MTTWYAWYRAPNGAIVKVTCQAESVFYAKQILEGQYGAGNLTGSPLPVN